jgi:hypothetical protein
LRNWRESLNRQAAVVQAQFKRQAGKPETYPVDLFVNGDTYPTSLKEKIEKRKKIEGEIRRS